MRVLKQKKFMFIFFVFPVVCAGCASIPGKNKSLAAHEGYLLNTSEEESVYDAASALTAVTGAVSDKELSQRELYQAVKKMKDDPEAQAAVDAVSSAFDQNDVQVKYSPATGKRYSADMEFDPETGVKLLILE